jgi:mannose-1-phosphate guanylyltransferase
MYVVIMAGGAGTRFWPMSRKHRPKQLLTLFSDRPMVAETVARFADIVPMENILVITNETLRKAVIEAVPELPPENIVAEPEARNTAPCIALAAAVIEAREGSRNVVMSVFPADHYIRDEDNFRMTAQRAARLAERGGIVTLGIEPTKPETGYGYMKRGGLDDMGAASVEKFVEKPDRETALRYLADGNYLWNAGIFAFRVDTILDEFARQMPALSAAYPDLLRTVKEENLIGMAKAYSRIPAVSIDYGVMEGAKEVRVIPATFGWSDVGAWDALSEVTETDDRGNVIIGDVVAIDCSNSVFVGHDRRVLAAVGLDGIVVVDSEDALLVAPRERVQEVRAVVDSLKTRESNLT